MSERFFKAWFVFVLCAAIAWTVFLVREWRECKASGGIFIATNVNWPVCINAEVLR